jgi:hypothetical protein
MGRDSKNTPQLLQKSLNLEENVRKGGRRAGIGAHNNGHKEGVD